jgi:hypothetical protein
MARGYPPEAGLTGIYGGPDGNQLTLTRYCEKSNKGIFIQKYKFF